MSEALANHPAAEALTAFGLGKLSAEESEAVARHLDACAACRRTAEGVADDALANALRAGRGAAELLPLVYDELRKLAAAKLAHENPGQTLEATALVHEAYLRIAGPDADRPWDGRGHFFAAAAEAMRRILVENARRKKAEKHGGGLARHDAGAVPIAAPEPVEDLVALDEALDRLAGLDPVKADLVKLRYFAGLTIAKAADALGLSPATAKRYWEFSRAWLFQAVTGDPVRRGGVGEPRRAEMGVQVRPPDGGVRGGVGSPTKGRTPAGVGHVLRGREEPVIRRIVGPVRNPLTVGLSGRVVMAADEDGGPIRPGAGVFLQGVIRGVGYWEVIAYRCGPCA